VGKDASYSSLAELLERVETLRGRRVVRIAHRPEAGLSTDDITDAIHSLTREWMVASG
jgi:tRNA(Met) C34 N-acetyltransferase TmcA